MTTLLTSFKHPSKKENSIKIWLCFYYVSHKSHEWSCLKFIHRHDWLYRQVRGWGGWVEGVSRYEVVPNQSAAVPVVWGTTGDLADSMYRHTRPACLWLVKGFCFCFLFPEDSFYYPPTIWTYIWYLFILFIYIFASIYLCLIYRV